MTCFAVTCHLALYICFSVIHFHTPLRLPSLRSDMLIVCINSLTRLTNLGNAVRLSAVSPGSANNF